MTFTPAEADACQRLVRLALDEDLGGGTDITSEATIPPDRDGRAVLVARSPGVVAGLPAAEMSFRLVDPGLVFTPELGDGAEVARDSRLAVVRGRMRSILT